MDEQTFILVNTVHVMSTSVEDQLNWNEDILTLFYQSQRLKSRVKMLVVIDHVLCLSDQANKR